MAFKICEICGDPISRGRVEAVGKNRIRTCSTACSKALERRLQTDRQREKRAAEARAAGRPVGRVGRPPKAESVAS